METIENVKINIPKGYEIDKENSVINLEEGIVDIKLKKKTERWRDNEQNIMTGYYIGKSSDIIKDSTYINNVSQNYKVFATEKQAKSALAMARISQIMANDERFGGVITDEEWKMPSVKYVLERHDVYINKHIYHNTYHFLAFHTEEQRKLFLRENEDLIRDYLMLD